MKFFCNIACDNAAFGETPKERHREVARILEVTAVRVRGGAVGADQPVLMRDLNGNVVAQAQYLDDTEPRTPELPPGTYRVRWSIDLEASSVQAAAEEALRIQRDRDSIATVFTVDDGIEQYEIDLTPEIR